MVKSKASTTDRTTLSKIIVQKSVDRSQSRLVRVAQVVSSGNYASTQQVVSNTFIWGADRFITSTSDLALIMYHWRLITCRTLISLRLSVMNPPPHALSYQCGVYSFQAVYCISNTAPQLRAGRMVSSYIYREFFVRVVQVVSSVLLPSQPLILHLHHHFLQTRLAGSCTAELQACTVFRK